MEEADKLLIESLKMIKVNVNKIEDFDSPLFINALINCFEYISKMLSKEDNFIDVKFLRSQKIEESADKFRLCQKISQYLKTLDYYNDISFNSFLFPNPKDTRKILAFLFEIMFKDDEDAEDKKQPTNTYELRYKKRMVLFKNKPWVMPEFLKIQKPMFVGSGDIIVTDRNADVKRVANCKSKKAKGVFEMMQALSASGGQAHVNAYENGMSLSMQLNQSTWLRGQKVLAKRSNDYFSRDEDDEQIRGKNPNKISKIAALKGFQQAIEIATTGATASG